MLRCIGFSVALPLAALSAYGCGSSDSDGKSSTGGMGAGGANSNGGKVTSAGSSQGGKSSGGTAQGGEPSGGDSSAVAGAGQGGTPSTSPGTFSSVWRYDAAEITFYDPANPQPMDPVKVDFPSTHAVPGEDREVELYRQFRGTEFVTYAYYAGERAFYRISQPAVMADEAYLVSTSTSSRVFTIEEGQLSETTTGVTQAGIVITQTRYRKLDGPFPPSNWPKEFVNFDAQGALP